MLEIRNLTVHYGAVNAINSVEMTISEGNVVCLLGANGAGKSTLLGAIMGIVPKVSGSIQLEGEDILGASTEEVVFLFPSVFFPLFPSHLVPELR